MLIKFKFNLLPECSHITFALRKVRNRCLIRASFIGHVSLANAIWCSALSSTHKVVLNNCVTALRCHFVPIVFKVNAARKLTRVYVHMYVLYMCTFTKQLVRFKSIVKWKVRYAPSTISKFCVVVHCFVSVHSKRNVLLRLEVTDCTKIFFPHEKKNYYLFNFYAFRVVWSPVIDLSSYRYVLISCKICDNCNFTLST